MVDSSCLGGALALAEAHDPQCGAVRPSVVSDGDGCKVESTVIRRPTAEGFTMVQLAGISPRKMLEPKGSHARALVLGGGGEHDDHAVELKRRRCSLAMILPRRGWGCCLVRHSFSTVVLSAPAPCKPHCEAMRIRVAQR